MMMTLYPYHFEVIYKPGKEMHIADTLSRAFLPDCCAPEIETTEIDLFINSLLKTIPISEERLEEVQRETEKDKNLQQLKILIHNGWPASKSLTPPGGKEYWGFREELSELDGIIFKGSRIIVPQSMRTEMLKKIHQSHMGIEKCKNRARDVLYWPGMNKSIEEMVMSCSTCQTYRNCNQKEPLIPHAIPDGPWQKVAVDLFQFKGKEYVACTDYLSKYFEVSELRGASTSVEVINILKSFFARHGIPLQVYTDNGPQLSSLEFAEFARAWQFSHITSSPTYPQSNGLIERNIQTIKSLLKKAWHSKSDPYLALLEFRNTPFCDLKASPAQMLMSRRLRSVLPTTFQQLQPKIVDLQQTKKHLSIRQANQKADFDKNAKPLPSLSRGDNVRVYRKKTWNPAVVLEKRPEPRSFVIKTREGQVLRRNRRDLIKDSVPQVWTPFDEDSAVQPALTTTTSMENSQPEHSGDTHYTTRFGRIIRRPQRLIENI